MSPLLLALAMLSAAAGPPEEPVSVTGEVSAPVLVLKLDPEYPEAARRSYRTGNVILQAVIQETGAVTDLELRRSAGEELDAAAIDAVKRWRYEPATLAGKPVPVYFTIVVRFALDLEGRVLDAGTGSVLVVFERGAPELTLPAHGKVLRLAADHPQGEPAPVGGLTLERRASSGERPTYEARLTDGGPVRAGDLVRVLLGERVSSP